MRSGVAAVPTLVSRLCYLSDEANRVIGMPAFEPGQKVSLTDNMGDDI